MELVDCLRKTDRKERVAREKNDGGVYGGDGVAGGSGSGAAGVGESV